MRKHLPMFRPDDGGGGQGGQDPTLDQEQEVTTEEGGDESTLSPEELEELREERRRAVTASIEKHKKWEEATAEKERIYLESQVLKAVVAGNDPKTATALQEAYNKDPELAEEIAQSNFGISYREALNKVQSTGGDTDVETAVQKALRAEKEREAKKKIKKIEVDFFIENDIPHDSPNFKKIIKEYRNYTVTSVSQARRLLRMITQDVTGSKVSSASPSDLLSAVAPTTGRTSSFQSAGGNNKVSPSMKEYLINKFGEEKAKQYLRGK